jgi:hypothetical protein
MSTYEKLVQSAAEKLMEDERLRTNLADDEAQLLVNWAIAWLQDHIARARDESAARQVAQAETTRLRSAMQRINDVLAEGKTPALIVALKELGLPSPAKTTRTALDRKGMIRALTSRLAESWSETPSTAGAGIDKDKRL